jgi:E3 ubiquitin-protein ligase UBR2
MTTSAGGGGYCDCGDIEAWKKYPSCLKHSKKDDNSEIQTCDDIIEKLPNDLVQRARQLFDYLLEYVIDVICGDHKQHLPQHLKPEKETDEYITVLFNDEIHSYDQVIIQSNITQDQW